MYYKQCMNINKPMPLVYKIILDVGNFRQLLKAVMNIALRRPINFKHRMNSI